MNEIFRRADPEGRTIGEYLRQEVAGPLRAGVHIGFAEGDADSPIDRISDLKSWSLTYVLGQSMLPYALGSKVNLSVLEMLGGGFMLWRAGKKAAAELKEKGVEKPIQIADMDVSKGKKVEKRP